MRYNGDGQRGRDGRRLDTTILEALRAVAGPPGATDIDWWTLRRTIVDDAGAYLDGPRRGRRWWEYAAGWIRPAVPLGLAASVMAVVVVGSVGAVSGSTLSVSGPALSTVAVADTADGSLWLHAVRGGGGASDAAAVVDAALASAK